MQKKRFQSLHLKLVKITFNFLRRYNPNIWNSTNQNTAFSFLSHLFIIVFFIIYLLLLKKSIGTVCLIFKKQFKEYRNNELFNLKRKIYAKFYRKQERQILKVLLYSVLWKMGFVYFLSYSSNRFLPKIILKIKFVLCVFVIIKLFRLKYISFLIVCNH